jgi:uncharacterized protein YgiM (DUF1202 family)
MKKVLLMVTGLMVVVAQATSLWPQERGEKQIVITAGQTGIYKFPSEKTTQLGNTSRGEKFVVLGRTTEGWYQIRYGEGVAYVRGSDAEMARAAGVPAKAETKAEATQTTAQRKIEITAAETQIRSYPANDQPVLATVKSGEQFPVMGRTANGWYQITFNDKLAYIPEAHARVVPITQAAPGKTAPVKPAAKEETPTVVETPPVSEEAPLQPISVPTPPAVERSKFPTTWVVVGGLFVLLIIFMIVKSTRETHKFEDRVRHKFS